jgi:hypothetical protein
LQQHHLARVCMQAGGILWRLAMEVMCPDFVFRGPSSDALDLELGFCDEGAGHTVLLDDDISEAEHNTVIGSYVHKSAKGRVDSEPSWWPGDLQFKNASLWTGSWTQSAKDWYQKQRQSYLTNKDGQALQQPKTGIQWRKALRNRSRTARCVCTAAVYQTERFLDSQIQ